MTSHGSDGIRRKQRAIRTVKVVALSVAGGAATGLLLSIVIANFMTGEHEPAWRSVVGQQMMFWGAWGLLLVPLWTAIAGAPADGARRWARIATAGTLAWLAHSALLYTLAASSSPRAAGRGIGDYFGYAIRVFYIDSVVLAGIISAMVALWQRSRARENAARADLLGMQLEHARLRALEAQLHPHFLFNALHSISMLARANDVERIVSMTAGLGELLRAMLDTNDDRETTVADELVLVERYLAIERIRFHDRLLATIDAEPAALAGRAPRFVLQPLVENAMRHGLAAKIGLGRLHVTAARSDNSLILTVTDDGAGISAAGAAGRASAPGALGLRLTRERLAAMYGSESSLRLERAAEGGTAATVTIPWHTTPFDSEVAGAAPAISR